MNQPNNQHGYRAEGHAPIPVHSTTGHQSRLWNVRIRPDHPTKVLKVFASGVGPRDEVLTASNTWVSAINAIMHGNGIPVFCDIAPDCFVIDPDEIRKKAGPRTKAVIVTHLYGIPAEMDEILEVAKDKNLVVIEDSSHCQGATYKGKKLEP